MAFDKMQESLGEDAIRCAKQPVPSVFFSGTYSKGNDWQKVLESGMLQYNPKAGILVEPLAQDGNLGKVAFWRLPYYELGNILRESGNSIADAFSQDEEGNALFAGGKPVILDNTPANRGLMREIGSAIVEDVRWIGIENAVSSKGDWLPYSLYELNNQATEAWLQIEETERAFVPEDQRIPTYDPKDILAAYGKYIQEATEAGAFAKGFVPESVGDFTQGTYRNVWMRHHGFDEVFAEYAQTEMPRTVPGISNEAVSIVESVYRADGMQDPEFAADALDDLRGAVADKAAPGTQRRSFIAHDPKTVHDPKSMRSVADHLGKQGNDGHADEKRQPAAEERG